VLANREDVVALAAVAPDSAVVKRIESSLNNVVALRVKQHLAADDVAGARALLLDLGDLMPEEAVNAQRELIAKATSANQSKAFDTLERLRRAVLSGRLDKTGATGAQDLYAQLQRSGSSSDVLSDARDYLAYGYLKDARHARQAGDRQRAAAQIAVGTKLQPSATIQSMLTAEQQELDGATSSSPGEAGSAKIDAARGQFAQSAAVFDSGRYGARNTRARTRSTRVARRAAAGDRLLRQPSRGPRVAGSPAAQAASRCRPAATCPAGRAAAAME